MAERYFGEPYEFVPPYRSKFWCRVLKPLIPSALRQSHQISKWRFEGIEHLRGSLDVRAGVLLAPNHSRFADAGVLSLLGQEVGQYLYYTASYHLFKQNRWDRWLLNRMGGFSIHREGADRDAIRESVRILENAERPLVIFPEGTWFRQNDRLGPLQEGVGLILRYAAKKTKRPIHLHPIAIKYWFLRDPRPVLEHRLEALERKLTWHSQSPLGIRERIEKVGSALLAIKEIEHLGSPGPGSLSERLGSLANHLVSQMERRHLRNGPRTGLLLQRIRNLRQLLVRKLVDAKLSPEANHQHRVELENLLFCELLFGQSLDYLDERPSHERLAEAVQRIEEDLTDGEKPVAPMGAVVRIAPPMLVSDYLQDRRDGSDPLIRDLAETIQRMLDTLLEKGPPPEWRCPTRLEPTVLATAHPF